MQTFLNAFVLVNITCYISVLISAPYWTGNSCTGDLAWEIERLRRSGWQACGDQYHRRPLVGANQRCCQAMCLPAWSSPPLDKEPRGVRAPLPRPSWRPKRAIVRYKSLIILELMQVKLEGLTGLYWFVRSFMWPPTPRLWLIPF
jgi:hypothetical protein